MSVDLSHLDLHEGDILAGKFRVERVLGAGGMGVVVEATHITLKDRVALKFLRTPKFADQTTITRFLREAQAAARIKSPHVARVLDVGTLDDGSPYMVMEFLEGIDLGTLLDREGVLPVEQAMTYALQTCEALAAAHASGVVHRDVKPSNLFLTHGPDRTPLVKVLDFGISKMIDGTTSGSITETQRAVGSPSYMAPEQMRSAKRVDPRADIWSMGVVLYDFLGGRAPFVAETIPELYALILDKGSRPTPLRSLRPDLPEELERIAERCLQKDAGDRYADVAELAAALAPFGGDLGPVSAARTRRILEAAPITGDSSRSDRAAGAEASSRSTGGRGAAAPRPTTPRSGRESEVSPPTVRQGRQASTSQSGVDGPVSPNPAGRTATSFSDTQSPARRPRTVMTASIAAALTAAAIAAVVFMQARSDVPGAELGSASMQGSREPAAHPSAAPAARAPVEESTATPPLLPAATASGPASPAPSASVSTPSVSSSNVPRPPAASARPQRPKSPGAPPSDDVLMHRK